MKRCAVRALSLLLLAVLTGCGDRKQMVTGTVSLDGKPVVNGSITFVKSEGELVREGAVIKDGRFQTSVPPGKYKIELSASRVVGTRKQKGFDGKDEVIEEYAELFPERFNTKTELIEDIKAGENILTFDLKSEK